MSERIDDIAAAIYVAHETGDEFITIDLQQRSDEIKFLAAAASKTKLVKHVEFPLTTTFTSGKGGTHEEQHTYPTVAFLTLRTKDNRKG